MTSRQQPCPYRIVQDFGSGFSMGCVAGCLFYFARGAWYGARKAKFRGGVQLLRIRAPILGGSFAMWAGIFSITDCALIGLRNKEDSTNQIIAGALTGGLLAFRSGWRIAGKNAMFGGLILCSITVVEKYMIKKARQEELDYQNRAANAENQKQRKQIAKIRPDLFENKGDYYVPVQPTGRI